MSFFEMFLVSFKWMLAVSLAAIAMLTIVIVGTLAIKLLLGGLLKLFMRSEEQAIREERVGGRLSQWIREAFKR